MVFLFRIYRECFKICFHDAETFFYFLSPFIYSDNCFRCVFQVRVYGVESIVLFLLKDLSVPYGTQIITVFDGIGYDQLLFHDNVSFFPFSDNRRGL